MISLTKKGCRVEVYLRKNPLTGKKIRKVKFFYPVNNKMLKAAKMWKGEMLTSYKTGELDLEGSMKLSNYLDYWFETYVEANTAYQTQKRYKTLCDCIKTHIGHISLEKLKTPIIDRFYADFFKKLLN